jgi:peroxiredoxin
LAQEHELNRYGSTGPFTPACSESHVPGFINANDALKAKGVSDVIWISVMDGFVMNAFAKAYKAGDK